MLHCCPGVITRKELSVEIKRVPFESEDPGNPGSSQRHSRQVSFVKEMEAYSVEKTFTFF